MKAVVYNKKNAPNALKLQEVEKQIPKDNEFLVKIVSVAVNAADYRSIQMGMVPKRKIFGADIAGIIEAVSKDVVKFKVGDEVFGDIASYGFGGFAEYVAVTEKFLALKPKEVPFDTAAALPMASTTALQALRNLGHIQAGQKVLICGAGGGVGMFAVQLAKHDGAVVTAVCGSGNVDIVKGLGADKVIDYTKNDYMHSQERYDLILAINGNNKILAYRKLLTEKGICVFVGGALSQIFKTMFFGRILSIGSKKMCLLSTKQNASDLELIIQLVSKGKLQAVIDRHYPLNETQAAINYIREGHTHGKVIVDVVQ